MARRDPQRLPASLGRVPGKPGTVVHDGAGRDEGAAKLAFCRTGARMPYEASPKFGSKQEVGGLFHQHEHCVYHLIEPTEVWIAPCSDMLTCPITSKKKALRANSTCVEATRRACPSAHRPVSCQPKSPLPGIIRAARLKEGEKYLPLRSLGT